MNCKLRFLIFFIFLENTKGRHLFNPNLLKYRHNFASKPLHLSGKSHVEMIKFHPVFTRDEIKADPGNARACLPQWGAVKISDFY